MAVDTLSPDWDFDRVDDGSQSKPRRRARRAGRRWGQRTARCGAALRSRPLGTLPRGGTGARCVTVGSRLAPHSHPASLRGVVTSQRRRRSLERPARGQPPRLPIPSQGLRQMLSLQF